MSFTIRRGAVTDVATILHLVSSVAMRNQLLPLEVDSITRMLPSFYVAEELGRVIGCGQLSILTLEVGEIRSLVVEADRQGHGVGASLVAALKDEAARMKISKLIVLTRQPVFFARMGFADHPAEEILATALGSRMPRPDAEESGRLLLSCYLA